MKFLKIFWRRHRDRPGKVNSCCSCVCCGSRRRYNSSIKLFTAGRKKATGSSYCIRSKGKKRKNDFGRNGFISNGILLSLKQKIAWSILTPLAIAEDYISKKLVRICFFPCRHTPFLLSLPRSMNGKGGRGPAPVSYQYGSADSHVHAFSST